MAYRTHFLIGALLLGLSGGASAAESQAMSCPESLPVTEQAGTLDKPWEVVADQGRGGYGLDGVRFYSGPPQEMATLVPDQTRQTSRERKSVWRLPSNGGQQYWLACAYRNTALLATRALPPELKSCELTEQLLPSGKVLKVVAVVCK
ncbi:hypothetical protein FNU76_14740 [Chitinimonas arctica]|uniref:Uncharacterized protein n=1 Tax=Chitinimonas arctica TaxID=2594795 RepID=A0A516SH72_9NEIS|nr:STY0301 family protein [Chitinimonas arctica]QDQ27511.1 hypothetical protein FNU76_14740 [Chitinimonas arctica]